MIRFIILIVLLSKTLAAEEKNCSLQYIKSEVTKFHGPQWNAALQLCQKSEVKQHLKTLLSSPFEHLKEYDAENQKFIFRNVVKSYGHFGRDVQDLKILATLYNNKNNQIGKIFGDYANFFRITILEAMANTGNIESLNFFQKIMENDNNVLFLQQYAAEFSIWVLEGIPLDRKDFEAGSRTYGEYFFPNLESSADIRFQDNGHILEKLQEKKIILKNLVQDMLERTDRFLPILNSLKKLNTFLEHKTFNDLDNATTQLEIKKDHAPYEHSKVLHAEQSFKNSTKQSVMNKARSPASIANKSEKQGYIFLLMGMIIALFIWFRLKQEK